jgi:hypothetical protein
MCNMTQEVGRCKCVLSMDLSAPRLKIRCQTNSRRIKDRNLFREKDTQIPG